MYIIKYNWCFLRFYPKFFWIFFLLYINCWFLQSLTESDNFLCGKMTMKTFKLSVKLTVTHSLLSASERAWLPKNWVPAWAARKITTKYDSAWKIILILVENLNVVIKIYFDSFHTIFSCFEIIRMIRMTWSSLKVLEVRLNCKDLKWYSSRSKTKFTFSLVLKFPCHTPFCISSYSFA